MNGNEVEKRTLGSNAFNSTSFLTSVDFTDIGGTPSSTGGATRTNYNLGFKPPTGSYAGFRFYGTDGQNAGYFLVRGTSDNDVYGAEGITLVGDQGWLTFAHRYSTNKGIRFMTGDSSASVRMTIASDGDININNSLTVGSDLGVNGFIKDSLYKHAGDTNWRTKKYVRSVGITGGSINNSWVQLSRVTIGSTYEKVTIKFTINGYDDVSSGVEAIDVRYENGASAQENHQMAWYSTDDHANLFKNVRSIRSSSSGLSNTYDLYVQMAGDWRDNFTVVAESWTTHAGDSPISYITAAGSANEPSAGSNDIERTERRWYTENSFMYLGSNRVYTTGDFVTSDFASSSHTHDDRYYTESEIDTTLAGYSTTSHNHDSTYAAVSHDHDDRYHKLDFDSVTGAHSTDAKSGTWTGSAGSSWGSYKPGNDSDAGSYYNDGTGYAEYNIPTGYTTAYIGQLKWDSGGYFDVYAKDSNGNLILRGRYMSLQSIENSNHNGNHDYQQIIKISGLDGMSALRIQNRTGRLHLQGIGWTKEEDTDSTADALTHWDLIYSKPSTFAPSTHSHSDATTSAAGFMSSTDKTKLDGIASGAEVNVQSDWNATSGDSFIQNKPTLGTASASAATDFISATSADTAAELITFAKGTTTDGNSKFYNWRALDNTASTGNSFWRIARITGTHSSRFMITLAGRSTSYSDTTLPAMGHIVGQLSNDNNYDVVFYNHSTASSEAVSEVGIVNVSNTVVDVYVKAGQYAELTATGHISDGSFVVYSNTGSDGNTTVDGYITVTEYTVMNTGNSDVLYKSGGTMTGDVLLGTNSIAADTTSPTAHIQVGAGTSNATNRSGVALLGDASSGGVVNALGLINTAAAANSNGVALNFHNANTYSPTGQILLQQNSSGTTTHSAMKFFTYGSNNLTHQMSIKSDGVVRFNSYGTGILSTDGSGNISAISDGTSGQVLTTNGSGGFSFTTVTSGSSYTLPTATDSVLGGIKVGDNLTITEGVLSATDTDTVYVHPTSAGNKHIPTGGAAGQFLKYSSSGTATWATPSYTTNTDTTYSAGTGLDLTGTTFSIEPDLRDGVTRIGKDTSNYIAIGADTNVIDFHVGGVWVARMESDGDLHMKGDVIAFSDIFNP